MAKEISISQIPIFPLNLSGLVLFCMDSYDSESRIFWFSLFEEFWLQNPQTSTETSPKRVSR